ncbi:MAG: response regulator [Sphingomonadaceae bacterium]|nr:response regulator [Sphingomonadaceae bacterium]
MSATRANADRVHTELIDTQYRQARNNIVVENACLAFMVATALLHADWRIVAGWAAIEVGTQVYRHFRMLRRYAAGIPAVNFAAYWSRHHAIYQTTLGLIWGLTIWLFASADDPIAVAESVCVIIILTAGAVPGQSYNPPALYGYLVTTYVPTVVRLLTFPGLDYHLFGVLLAAFAGALVLMCRLQAESFAAGVRIRFENVELVEALRAQTATAEAASLAKSQFLAAASHDLRQPLYALGLFSGTLATLDLPADARTIVGHVRTNIDALESLFSGLLDISRLEAGVVAPKLEPIATDALFERLDQYLRPIAAEAGLTLRYRSDGSAILSDPVLIEQILLNLGTNALRNTMRGGVLIAARRRDNIVGLEVWDTGVGIAPDDLARIFDDFIQVGNPERNRRKGMGLGLAIARRSARLLGTRIEVASRVGRGSMFRLAQPAAAAPPPPAAAETVDPIAGLRVLVIDDDPDVREAIALLLGHWGVVADVAGDADAALARIATGPRHAMVLTDYRLPGAVDGLGLVAALRQAAGWPLPACVVTGDLDPAIIAAAAACGIPLLHKPVQPARLRALIAHVARA